MRYFVPSMLNLCISRLKERLKEREKEKGKGKKENTQWQQQTTHSGLMGIHGANLGNLGCGLGDLPPSSCETWNNSLHLTPRKSTFHACEKKRNFWLARFVWILTFHVAGTQKVTLEIYLKILHLYWYLENLKICFSIIYISCALSLFVLLSCYSKQVSWDVKICYSDVVCQWYSFKVFPVCFDIK